MFLQLLNKKLVQALVIMGATCASLTCLADEPTSEKVENAEEKKPSKEELFSATYLQKLSQTYGHLIQKSLKNPLFTLDANDVIAGIQEAQAGKTAPLTEKEYEESLALIQQYAFEDMSQKNLKEAEKFLETNATQAGVVEIEKNKLQYKVLQEGSGDLVTEETMPTIIYSATYSDGTKLGSSEQQGGPIDVQLTDTIPGFKKGILGMKVGEKRQIFIHPEYGYGVSGPIPNGLLVFEVEVTKIQPKPEEIVANDDSGDDENDDEDDDDDEDDEEEVKKSDKS